MMGDKEDSHGFGDVWRMDDSNQNGGHICTKTAIENPNNPKLKGSRISTRYLRILFAMKNPTSFPNREYDQISYQSCSVRSSIILLKSDVFSLDYWKHILLQNFITS
jgi:hypothetical protein